MLFFEGSEKKVEIVVTEDAPSLRSLGDHYWEELVNRCNATILSTLRNDDMDAYLLSESSLFVWDDRMLMITCGVITLVDSVTYFLDHYGRDKVAMITFQRKNEYESHLQKSTFSEDVSRLGKLVQGEAFRFGHLDGHHNYIWHLKQPYHPPADDITTELLMYHIAGEAARYLRSESQNIEGIRKLLKFNELFPGFDIDDFLFEPYGYSMNGIRGDQYITMHITPQEDSSYVSFETDLDIPNECPEILDNLVTCLNPTSFDLITFNTLPKLTIAPDMHCVAHHVGRINCGYDIVFKHILKTAQQAFGAVQIS